MNVRTFGLIVLSFAVLPALAAAQAPPASKPQPAQPATASQTSRCADARTHRRRPGRATPRCRNPTAAISPKSWRSRTACSVRPIMGDQAMQAPTPPGGRMPVIKPPGTPGSSDQSVNPK